MEGANVVDDRKRLAEMTAYSRFRGNRVAGGQRGNDGTVFLHNYLAALFIEKEYAANTVVMAALRIDYPGQPANTGETKHGFMELAVCAVKALPATGLQLRDLALYPRIQFGNAVIGYRMPASTRTISISTLRRKT